MRGSRPAAEATLALFGDREACVAIRMPRGSSFDELRMSGHDLIASSVFRKSFVASISGQFMTFRAGALGWGVSRVGPVRATSDTVLHSILL